MKQLVKSNGEQYDITIPGGMNRSISGVILDVERQLKRRRANRVLVDELIDSLHHHYDIRSMLKDLRKIMKVKIDGIMTEHPFPGVIK